MGRRAGWVEEETPITGSALASVLALALALEQEGEEEGVMSRKSRKGLVEWE
jgi:hypothetical protein